MRAQAGLVSSPLLAALVALTASSVTTRARAEPSPQEKGLATTLFNDGRALLAEGKVPEACRKLEESRRLDPLPGTVLNLAACHEKEGRMASAFSEFREARALAERDGRDDRVAFADEHLRAIEPKISRVVLQLAPGAEVPELRITFDGTLLGRAAWGTRIPVDPGEHVIEAAAPQKKTARMVVKVMPDAAEQTAVIAALADEAAPVAPEPSPVAAPAIVARDAPPAEPARDAEGMSTRRRVAIGVAGVGVVGAISATIFGARALQKHGDPAATCTTVPCSSDSVSLNNQAKFAADFATVSSAIALVGIGVGAFLWFGDTNGKANAAAVSVVPRGSPGSAGVTFRGRF